MHCNAKTMIKVAAALGGVLGAAYLLLPGARELPAASAPVLLALVCPITMILMMFMMRGTTAGTPAASAEQPRRGAAAEAEVEGQPAKAKEAASSRAGKSTSQPWQKPA